MLPGKSSKVSQTLLDHSKTQNSTAAHMNRACSCFGTPEKHLEVCGQFDFRQSRRSQHQQFCNLFLDSCAIRHVDFNLFREEKERKEQNPTYNSVMILLEKEEQTEHMLSFPGVFGVPHPD